MTTTPQAWPLQLLRPLALLAGLALQAPAPAAPNDGMPSVRELTPQESAVVAGLPALTTAQLNLRVAAHTRVSAYGKGTPRSAVQRRSGGTAAAVYSGLPVTTTTLLPSATPPSGQLVDFITQGDLSQAWATMLGNGVPHMFVWGYGDFTAEAQAGWTSTLTLPASSSQEVFVRLVIPPVVVSGDTENEGAHPWRARLRAELLVNGFPAWSSEALRLRVAWPGCSGGCTVEDIALQQFGSPLAFPTNDEDASSTNNSAVGNTSQASAKKTVQLSLGRFAAGAQIHLAMVLRGTAWSEPGSPGGTNNRCRWDYEVDRFFCSRAGISIDGATGEAPRVTYGP